MEQTEKKYEKYQAGDFLRDDDFLRAQIEPTEETDAYWQRVIEQHPQTEAAMKRAQATLRSVALNRHVFSEAEAETLWKATCGRYRNYRRRRIVYAGLAAAACLALLCMLSLFRTGRMQAPGEPLAVWESLPRLDTVRDVQLILGQEKKITLNEDADIVYDKKDNIQVTGRKTKSSVVSQTSREIAFNRLIVPAGKRSFLTLGDGTRIWVNSGTQLRFPADMHGKQREIYVDGEIYIEVVREKHRPFVVHTPSFRVKVYGTKFNVTAYASDSVRSVVLVEGKVAVQSDSSKICLLPDQLYRAEAGSYRIESVDASRYISWKDGVLDFSGDRLADVALRLSRYYGVSIRCAPGASSRTCTGKLVLFDDPELTLRTLSDIFPIRYERLGNEIRIDARQLEAPPLP